MLWIPSALYTGTVVMLSGFRLGGMCSSQFAGTGAKHSVQQRSSVWNCASTYTVGASRRDVGCSFTTPDKLALAAAPRNSWWLNTPEKLGSATFGPIMVCTLEAGVCTALGVVCIPRAQG